MLGWQLLQQPRSQFLQFIPLVLTAADDEGESGWMSFSHSGASVTETVINSTKKTQQDDERLCTLLFNVTSVQQFQSCLIPADWLCHRGPNKPQQDVDVVLLTATQHRPPFFCFFFLRWGGKQAVFSLTT